MSVVSMKSESVSGVEQIRITLGSSIFSDVKTGTEIESFYMRCEIGALLY